MSPLLVIVFHHHNLFQTVFPTTVLFPDKVISLYRLRSLTFVIPSCLVFSLLSLIHYFYFYLPLKYFPSSIYIFSMYHPIIILYYLFPPEHSSFQYIFLSRVNVPIWLYYLSTYYPLSVPLQSISPLIRNFSVQKSFFLIFYPHQNVPL